LVILSFHLYHKLKLKLELEIVLIGRRVDVLHPPMDANGVDAG
jgi:hypothetical protein